MGHRTIARAIVLDIDWAYTIAWFPALMLKTRRRLMTCVTKMLVRIVYARRYYVTLAEMRHGLTTLNSNNFVVYGQKHKVWVLVFLVRTSGTF